MLYLRADRPASVFAWRGRETLPEKSSEVARVQRPVYCDSFDLLTSMSRNPPARRVQRDCRRKYVQAPAGGMLPAMTRGACSGGEHYSVPDVQTAWKTFPLNPSFQVLFAQRR